VAVASAGPYASLHLASTPPLSFLQAGCPSCHPTDWTVGLAAQTFSMLLTGMMQSSNLFTYMPYRVSCSTVTAVGRSQLLARWPGTHSRIFVQIQQAAQTVLGVYLERTCSRITSASSALGGLLCAIQIHALAHSQVVSSVRCMNEVNARRARLVPGWVTVFGRGYNLGM